MMSDEFKMYTNDDRKQWNTTGKNVIYKTSSSKVQNIKNDEPKVNRQNFLIFPRNIFGLQHQQREWMEMMMMMMMIKNGDKGWWTMLWYGVDDDGVRGWVWWVVWKHLSNCLQVERKETTMREKREIILTSLIDSTVKVTPQRIVHVHPGYTVATWAIWQARSKRTWRSCWINSHSTFKPIFVLFLFSFFLSFQRRFSRRKAGHDASSN